MHDGDFLIVATQELPQTALSDYAERWGIEALFGSLKSRGFNFEATRMSEYDRIEKLLAFLAIALFLGTHYRRMAPRPKAHRNEEAWKAHKKHFPLRSRSPAALPSEQE
jgi:hypothetical protein